MALRDARNELLGIMTVEDAYEWDRASMAHHVLGSQDVRHPLVAKIVDAYDARDGAGTGPRKS